MTRKVLSSFKCLIQVISQDSLGDFGAGGPAASFLALPCSGAWGFQYIQKMPQTLPRYLIQDELPQQRPVLWNLYLMAYCPTPQTPNCLVRRQTGSITGFGFVQCSRHVWAPNIRGSVVGALKPVLTWVRILILQLPAMWASSNDLNTQCFSFLIYGITVTILPLSRVIANIKWENSCQMFSTMLGTL